MNNTQRTLNNLSAAESARIQLSPPVLEKENTKEGVTIETIRNTHQQWQSNDKELTEHCKNQFFRYLQLKQWAKENGKGKGEAEKQFKEALRLCKEMEVLE